MEENISPKEISFVCTCGKKLQLTLIGGQYQFSWQNKCECGRIWYLEDLSVEEEEVDETV
ncbi:MAG: hypothetical protein Q7S39_05980 [Ignavibacteria bacterium]|nr:hypothetical protein [Ignavibacteria bacterium]